MKTNQVRRQTSRADQSKQAKANGTASPQSALRQRECMGTETVPLPGHLAAEAEAMCRREGLTFSQLMERALKREMAAPSSPQTERSLAQLQQSAASVLSATTTHRDHENELDAASDQASALFYLLTSYIEHDNGDVKPGEGIVNGMVHLTFHVLASLSVNSEALSESIKSLRTFAEQVSGGAK